jgi:Protein of unknown function (DUF3460)
MAREYTSEITKFLNEMKAAKPALEAAQKQGRNLLWDKEVDREFVAASQAARIAQTPYVYGGAPAWTIKKPVTNDTQ